MRKSRSRPGRIRAARHDHSTDHYDGHDGHDDEEFKYRCFNDDYGVWTWADGIWTVRRNWLDWADRLRIAIHLSIDFPALLFSMLVISSVKYVA